MSTSTHTSAMRGFEYALVVGRTYFSKTPFELDTLNAVPATVRNVAVELVRNSFQVVAVLADTPSRDTPTQEKIRRVEFAGGTTQSQKLLWLQTNTTRGPICSTLVDRTDMVASHLPSPLNDLVIYQCSHAVPNASDGPYGAALACHPRGGFDAIEVSLHESGTENNAHDMQTVFQKESYQCLAAVPLSAGECRAWMEADRLKALKSGGLKGRVVATHEPGVARARDIRGQGMVWKMLGAKCFLEGGAMEANNVLLRLLVVCQRKKETVVVEYEVDVALGALCQLLVVDAHGRAVSMGPSKGCLLPNSAIPEGADREEFSLSQTPVAKRTGMREQSSSLSPMGKSENQKATFAGTKGQMTLVGQRKDRSSTHSTIPDEENEGPHSSSPATAPALFSLDGSRLDLKARFDPNTPGDVEVYEIEKVCWDLRQECNLNSSEPISASSLSRWCRAHEVPPHPTTNWIEGVIRWVKSSSIPSETVPPDKAQRMLRSVTPGRRRKKTVHVRGDVLIPFFFVVVVVVVVVMRCRRRDI